jgi:hypothetical protein
MQYHITSSVNAHQWEHEQAAILQGVRQQAEHDIAAQNPGSTVVIDAVEHTGPRADAAAPADGNNSRILVDFVVEYTVSGQQNTLDA